MEVVREERSESSVHKSCDEDFIVGSFSFTFHEAARESSCSVEFLLVVNLERKEVGSFGYFFSTCDGGEKHCASHFYDCRAVCLLGKFSGLDLDDSTVGEFDLFVDDVHYYCFYRYFNR